MTMNNVIKKYDANEKGRDFIVSDIHGCYSLLEQKLQEVNFNESTDRLFSVGDLCDRGPQSVRAIEFLNKNWFHPVRGNHDDILVSIYEDEQNNTDSQSSIEPYLTTSHFWFVVGGAWWQHISNNQKDQLYEAINQLPYFIEINTEDGEVVGIIHGEVPVDYTWQQCVKRVSKNDKIVINMITWDRHRFRQKLNQSVPGIDQIYCGHTILPTDYPVPYTLGNINYIDTGGWRKEMIGEQGYDLTLVELTNQSK